MTRNKSKRYGDANRAAGVIVRMWARMCGWVLRSSRILKKIQQDNTYHTE